MDGKLCEVCEREKSSRGKKENGCRSDKMEDLPKFCQFSELWRFSCMIVLIFHKARLPKH